MSFLRRKEKQSYRQTGGIGLVRGKAKRKNDGLVIATKLTIVGVGLLGGSLGLALRRGRLVGQVVGLVRRPEAAQQSVELGIVDRATLDPAEALEQAEMIVLCTPVGVMVPLMESFLPSLQPGAIVTDVGSTKGRLVRELDRILSGKPVSYVGAHPMAGSEKAGMEYAREDLFEEALCILTPGLTSSPEAIAQVERLWQGVGCRLIQLSPDEHDRVVARTSHLPHLTATALVRRILGEAQTEEGLFCATGFADTTRIASGDPKMWVDIALHNHTHLSRELQALGQELLQLAELVQRADSAALYQYLAIAKELRDRWDQQHRCRHQPSKETAPRPSSL